MAKKKPKIENKEDKVKPESKQVEQKQVLKAAQAG